MKKKFYRVIKHHYICAVCDLLEDRVYIEKTCAKNPKSRYCAHLRGEVKATADELSLEVIEKDFVAFRVLESLECTGAEAYKHVVAWGRFFKKEWCTLLMAPKTIAACEDLLPETEEIYRKVCASVTLEEVWRRKIPIEKKTVEVEKKYYLKQMNIRVREDVINWFKDFCREEQLLIAKSKVTNRHNISPIEVKSGKNYTLTSLNKFRKKYAEQTNIPYVLHAADLKVEDGVVYLPLYMAMFL